ncbi:Ankyrin Repeat Protein [Seminavis robusta]|uniref:Ankyrin Repeat Protein n=1 Tax=Seminavis robusta TaxID=568900 RepID=A0A9N8DE54_9STRA|nr:Ankyrin Repeat Protein [Seminavis robusta]|eukprot:Sro113_g055960.1 Ankyrin Repeat Protein (471) ;mRNA; r:23658-25182
MGNGHSTQLDDYGRTPLQNASRHGQIALGADILATSASYGDTPLHFASWHGHAQVVEELLGRHRVDIEVKNHGGYTPLHCASYDGRLKPLQLLLKAGTSVDVCNDLETGETALHYACRYNRVPCIQALQKFHANLNATMANGNTGLHETSHCGHVETVQELLRAGADISLRNKDGNTVLHEASTNDKDEIAVVQILVHDSDVELDAVNLAGQTALDLARSVKNWNVARFLERGPKPKRLRLSSTHHQPFFDVFLSHTGKQKLSEVDTMNRTFAAAGLNCFFDQQMRPLDGDPTRQMQYALETCRHAVVVISEEFLTKPYPCAELRYAFCRMKRLRRYYHWESLWIVLYCITTSFYKERMREGNEKANNHGAGLLPDICSSQVLVQWSEDMKLPWSELCVSSKNQLLEHDSEGGALESWKMFLHDYHLAKHKTTNDPFPLANDVYKSKGDFDDERTQSMVPPIQPTSFGQS